MPSMSVDDLNLIVWKYLLEQGYRHAAYVFAKESTVTQASKACAYSSLIPNGALVKMVNKGIHYTEAETSGKHATNISLMEAVLRLNPNRPIPAVSETESYNNRDDDEEDEDEEDEEVEEEDEEEEEEEEENEEMDVDQVPNTAEKVDSNRPVLQNNSYPTILTSEYTKYLTGHKAEAFICSWNPKENIVASGSGDSTGRIWYLNDVLQSNEKTIRGNCVILKHTFYQPGVLRQANHDVTSLDWSSNGQLLATGCYDGYARIWSKKGDLCSSLEYHKGPIFAVKWNCTSNYLVTAGVDRTTVVWNVDGTKRQEYAVHESSALDVDWVSQDAFASCSTDKKIVICRVGYPHPINILYGHQNEVNAIRYDSQSNRIASCSDDRTLKIWSLTQSTPLFSFSEHTKEIYTLRWRPTGYLVATASFDHTVRLFDVARGQCTRVLQGHTDPVYSVAYSPDGRYLASGCFDRSVFIWDVDNGTQVAKYVGQKTDGGIFEVSWSHDGNHLSASASDGQIILMDLRKILPSK